MHVPDSITVGPNRSTVRRLHQDDDQLPVRMEVPNSIRLSKKNIFFLHIKSLVFTAGSNLNTGISNGIDYSLLNDPNHSLNSTTQQLSFHPSNIELPSDDDYSTIDTPNNHSQHQPIKLAES